MNEVLAEMRRVVSIGFILLIEMTRPDFFWGEYGEDTLFVKSRPLEICKIDGSLGS